MRNTSACLGHFRRSLFASKRISYIPSCSRYTLSKSSERPINSFTVPCSTFVPNTRRFHAVSSAKRADVAKIKIQDVLHEFTPDRCRNFAIVAHIDHGKSTLADRLLEITGTISHSAVDLDGVSAPNKQFLDKLKVEKERGITVKAVTASMIYKAKDGKDYLLNLLDTPGHVDFAYEVHRSLLACQGALLLVDATQGVQAQTLTVLEAAQKRIDTIVGLVNKIDLPNAEPAAITAEVEALLGENGGSGGSILPISAKSGMGCEDVLQRIVDVLPPPSGDSAKPLRALVFDNFMDDYRGVVSLVAIIDGTIQKGSKLTFMRSGKSFEVATLGVLYPDEVQTKSLQAGQVGFITCGMKDNADAFLGDTIHAPSHKVEPLASFDRSPTMVYAGFYPQDNLDFPKLDEALQRLILTDRSVSLARETSLALGQGFRLGFYGALHLEVFRQRLEEEYASETVVTKPFVPLKMILKDGTEQLINSPAEFPAHDDPNLQRLLQEIQEPMIEATIIAPDEYSGGVMELCAQHRGQQIALDYLDSSFSGLSNTSAQRAKFTYLLPLSSIVTTFHSSLKSLSSGFASMDYSQAGYQKSDLVKLNIMVNGSSVDALCAVTHRSNAEKEGRAILTRLRDVMSRQQFEVVLQAGVGSRIIARERLAAYRKDVTAGLYGGHYERKLKHLNKQKEGKKRLKRFGKVQVDLQAFFH